MKFDIKVESLKNECPKELVGCSGHGTCTISNNFAQINYCINQQVLLAYLHYSNNNHHLQIGIILNPIRVQMDINQRITFPGNVKILANP